MSIVSGILSSNATNNASDKAKQAQDAATAEQQRQFDTTQTNFAPYKAIGEAAAPALAKFNETGGGDMSQDPLYKNQMSAATRQATQRAAGAGQGSGGGALQTRLAQLGNQVYNNTYQTKYQQLTDAIKVGQGAAGSIGAAGTALGAQAQVGATNTGNIAMNNANTQSALYGGMSSQAATLGSKIYSGGQANGWWGGSGAGAAGAGASGAGAAETGSVASSAEMLA